MQIHSCAALLLLVACVQGSMVAPTFSPLDYGGDPTGRRDSTAAVERCVAAALNASLPLPHERHEVDGEDHGGVMIDLQGGAYLLNRTLSIAAAPGGNWHLCCGSLLAAPGFAGGFVLAVPSPKADPNGNQDFTIRELAIDGGNVTGGISLIGALRAEIAGCYVIHFSSIGLEIIHGHEVLVHDSWFGQYNNDDPGQAPTNATGISVQGNDHCANTALFAFSDFFRKTAIRQDRLGARNLNMRRTYQDTVASAAVHDCVIFCATGVGIVNEGAANSFEGLHIYGVDVSGGSGWAPPGIPGPQVRPANFSRTAIVLTLFSHFSRVVNNYFDGTDVVIELGGTQSGGHKLCCAIEVASNVRKQSLSFLLNFPDFKTAVYQDRLRTNTRKPEKDNHFHRYFLAVRACGSARPPKQ
jgi:hypothetical protein|eukprot:COSAG06_NODE_2318_length_7091_cov_16.276173_3_plen_412_part_00